MKRRDFSYTPFVGCYLLGDWSQVSATVGNRFVQDTCIRRMDIIQYHPVPGEGAQQFLHVLLAK